MLDLNNVLLIFQQLSGCRNDRMNEQVPLINAAVKKLEDLLDEEKLKTANDIYRCEYAAACTAVYDYTCKECAREKIITTAGGSAVSSEDLNFKIKAALGLKTEALEGIRPYTAGCDFMFFTKA